MSEAHVPEGRFTIEARRAVSAPPEEVIEPVLDPSTWPDWQPEILSAAGPGTLRSGDVVSGSARMLGFVVAGHSAIVEAGPTAMEQDVIVGVRMRVRFEARRVGNGSEIHHSLTTYGPRGLSGRILSALLRVRLRRMQRRVLANLAERVDRAYARSPRP